LFRGFSFRSFFFCYTVHFFFFLRRRRKYDIIKV
jgi:hypothetical protein